MGGVCHLASRAMVSVGQQCPWRAACCTLGSCQPSSSLHSVVCAGLSGVVPAGGSDPEVILTPSAHCLPSTCSWACLRAPSSAREMLLHQLPISGGKTQQFLASSVLELREIDWAPKVVSETWWCRGIAGFWFEFCMLNNWEEVQSGLQAGYWDTIRRKGAILQNTGLSPGFMELRLSADFLTSSYCCLLQLGMRTLWEVKQEIATCHTLSLAAQVLLPSIINPS